MNANANPGNSLGLVLTSGGARGAYQAGVLRGLAKILQTDELPFSILSGISAGSINCAYLACHGKKFSSCVDELCKIWSTLKPSDIFRTSGLTLARTGLAWISDLGLGGWIGSGRGKSLLMTEPLRAVLQKHLDFEKLRQNISSGLMRGLAITATNYFSGTAVTFYEYTSQDGFKIEPWVRTSRIGVQQRITLEHIMASASIPVFFPAIQVGGAYYGDGSIRMNAPLSPAIHLGAKKVLAIGVRHERSVEKVTQLHNTQSLQYPHVSEIGGVLLNAMFLDGLEADVERMKRINQTILMIPEEKRNEHPAKLKHIPVMIIKPSKDLGALVAKISKNFPYTVRHFLKGLGASEERGWDFLSYLAFDGSYTQPLLELGYQDALESKDTFLEWMES